MLADFIRTLDLLDRNITLSINSWNNSYFDTFFYIFTQTWVWIPLAVLLVFLLWKQNGIKLLYILFAIALVILLADQISSSIIKPLVQRPRPTHNIDIGGLVHTVNGYRGGAFGFVSSHAANSVAFVLLTSLMFRRKLYAVSFTIWAILTSYSRIYLGVHYFGDVICGAVVGIISALIIYYLYKHILSHISETNYALQFTKLDRCSNILMFCTLILTVTIIVVYSIMVNIF